MKNTIGYLFANPRHGGVSLAVPCEPCQGFHWHGAGWIERPYYVPGDTTQRVSHCPNGNEYEWITVRPEPYRREWVTPQRGRFSTAYRREVTR